MKVLLAVDIEGIGGVFNVQQTRQETRAANASFSVLRN
ncbi:M55 family metallopeptidase [Paraburkholderia sp. CNPSo 3272]|nr:M55 family metallopeptidase [Paraburkholderia sp. CNPSo 3272]MCP3723543.1 M55 family metallopeptidase [Paraburkholderia sp. CNPSo 3272]